MSFYATKADIQRTKDLLLRQPDMFVSEVLYSGVGVIAVSSNDVTLTPATTPGLTPSALISAVGRNIEVVDSAGICYVGKIKANDADSVTFDATLARKTTTGAIGVASDWTIAGSVGFFVMTPHASYEWGDYFGIVKEPDVSWAEENATVEDIDGLIAEGLIKIEMDITGQNKNCVNGDVLKSVLNLTAQGAQSGNVEFHGGFRPAPRPKFRVTFFGLTDDSKDFMMQFFLGKLRSEGSFTPTGEDYAQLGWGFKPQADALRNEKVNAYRFQIAT